MEVKDTKKAAATGQGVDTKAAQTNNAGNTATSQQAKPAEKVEKADKAEKSEKVTPSMVTKAFRENILTSKGRPAVSITWARYVFDGFNAEELTAVIEACEELRSKKLETEIADLELRLAKLKEAKKS